MILSVAEGMGHDEGWVQGEVRSGVWRARGQGEGEGQGQGMGVKMRDGECHGGQKTALYGGNRAGEVATSSNRTTSSTSQQRHPTSKAVSTPTGSAVLCSSTIPTSSP